MAQDLKSLLKQSRQQLQLTGKEVMARTGIDPALLSKYEHGSRIPTDEHIGTLAEAYDLSYAELKKHQLAERILDLLGEESYAMDALQMAEPRIKYLIQQKLNKQFQLTSHTKQLLKQLDDLKDQYQQLNPATDVHSEKIQEHYKLTYTYESNKIEGNTLTLSETMLVIKEGITISGKSVKEHLEAINHHEAIDLLYQFVKQDAPFERSLLLDLHSLVLRGIMPQQAGRYRQVPVRIVGAEHIPPEPYLVPKLMEDYFLFYEAYKSCIHPVLLAAEMHERLVTIHPFVDGNGRTARLVMNLMLLMHGYPFVILKGEQEARLKYFQALEAVQVDADPTPFHQLIIRHLISNLEERIHFLGET